MKKIIICLVSINIVIWANFSRNSAGVVTDSDTNLQWQDSYNNRYKTTTWKGSIEYCNNLNLDGGRWRLPNVNEIRSLFLNGKDISHKSTFQQGHESSTPDYDQYWSSTTVVYFQDYQKRKYADYAYTNLYVKHKKGISAVRCVRDNQ